MIILWWEGKTTVVVAIYTFNSGSVTIILLTGRLRHTETGEPFGFMVREGDHRYNQAHYEALGEVGKPTEITY